MPAVSISDPRKATTFTVGKVEEGLAILVSEDLQLVELPFDCIPNRLDGSVEVGSLITLQLEHDLSKEMDRLDSLVQLQNHLLDKHGAAPNEELFRGIVKSQIRTHSSISVHWRSWTELANEHGWRATLKSLDCYVNESPIQSNISANETTLRMSGLDAGKTFDFYLVFRTTAGTFKTDVLSLSTASEEDLTGLRIMIIGDEDGSVRALAEEIGAVILDEQDWNEAAPPTHLIAHNASSIKADLLLRARQAAISIVNTEWLKACKVVGKLCPDSDFSK